MTLVKVPDERNTRCSNTFLLAIDGSAQTNSVVDAAESLAKLSNAEVRVLHVCEFGFAGRAGEVDLEDKTEAHQLVGHAVNQLTTAGITVSGTVRGALHGHAAREILDEATSAESTVIVMGSRGHTELVGLIVGSTIHKVLHLGKLPVLVVR